MTELNEQKNYIQEQEELLSKGYQFSINQSVDPMQKVHELDKVIVKL